MASLLAPISTEERIDSVDVMRGVSLCGILLMNITAMGMVFAAYNDPTVMGGATGWNLRMWITNNMFFEGTMRAMFSMLFGVGMVVITSRMEERNAGIEVADIYYRRTLWLLLFGVIHAYLLLWPGEILFAYGLFGMFLFPFRKLSAGKLILIAAILTLIGAGLNAYQYEKKMGAYEKFVQAQQYKEGESIPDEVKEGKEIWQGIMAEMKPDEAQKKKAIDKMQQGYFGAVMYLAPINRMVQTVFNYDYNPWDVLPMMLLGIALFKLGVVTAQKNYRFYLIMILAGYGIGLGVNYYETTTILQGEFSIQSQLKAGLTYPFGRIATAMGHIGIIMIFCKSGYLSFLRNAIGAVGRMALTNYIMHSVITAVIFTGIGFSMYGQLQRYELYYIVFSIWAFQLIASPIWLRYFRFGPLEWLWRSLTYRKVQPFRIRKREKEFASVLS